jgi:hypothetical protein
MQVISDGLFPSIRNLAIISEASTMFSKLAATLLAAVATLAEARPALEKPNIVMLRHGIHRTILKTAKSIFVPRFSILPEANSKFSRFGASRSCQVLKVSSLGRGEPKSSI